MLEKFDLVIREATKVQNQMKKQKENYRQENFKVQAQQRKKEFSKAKFPFDSSRDKIKYKGTNYSLKEFAIEFYGGSEVLAEKEFYLLHKQAKATIVTGAMKVCDQTTSKGIKTSDISVKTPNKEQKDYVVSKKSKEPINRQEVLAKKEKVIQHEEKEDALHKQGQLHKKEEKLTKTISKENFGRVDAFFDTFKPKETFIQLDLDNITLIAAQIREREVTSFRVGSKASTMYYEELIKALDERRLSYEDFAEIRDTLDQLRKFVDRISEDRYELSLWDAKQTTEECLIVFNVFRYLIIKLKDIHVEGLNKIITDEMLNDASTDSIFEFCCAINDNLHYYPNDLYIYLVLYSCVPVHEREIFRRSIWKYLYNITDTFDSYDAGNEDKYSSSEICRTTSSTSKWQSNPYGDNCEFDEDNAHYQDVL